MSSKSVTDLRDNRGTKIEVGQRVAYNLSGQVSLGEVVRVVEGEVTTESANQFGYHWTHVTKDPLIEVKPLLKTEVKHHDKPSKIRNPRNLLVLLDNES